MAGKKYIFAGMHRIRNILQSLSQPYPLCSPARVRIWTLLIISAFVSLFLVIFQPFGTASIPANERILILTGYGGVTALILYVFLFPFIRIMKEEKWKVWKEILKITFLLLTIALGNIIYSEIVFTIQGSLLNIILVFTAYTLAIGIIPVTFVIMLNYFRYLNRNSRTAGSLNALHHEKTNTEEKNQEQVMHLPASQDGMALRINVAAILYIEAKGNYLEVNWIENEIRRTRMVRRTITNMENEFNASEILFRCHRSFILNLDRIENFSGNAQGLLVSLRGSRQQVPVSRSYIPLFREQMALA